MGNVIIVLFLICVHEKEKMFLTPASLKDTKITKEKTNMMGFRLIRMRLRDRCNPLGEFIQVVRNFRQVLECGNVVAALASWEFGRVQWGIGKFVVCERIETDVKPPAHYKPFSCGVIPRLSIFEAVYQKPLTRNTISIAP